MNNRYLPLTVAFAYALLSTLTPPGEIRAKDVEAAAKDTNADESKKPEAEPPSEPQAGPTGSLPAGAPAEAFQLLEKAVQQQLKHRYGEAELSYNKVLEIVPDARGIHYQKAVCAINLKDSEGARYSLAKSIERGEMVPDAHNLLGVIAGLEGGHVEAEEHFRAAISVNSRDPQFHFNLGEALRKTGKASEAVQAYRQASILKPHEPLYQFKLQLALIETGQLEDVSARIEEALGMPEPTGDWLLLAAAQHLAKGENELAAEKIARAQTTMTSTMFFSALMDPYFSSHAKEPAFQKFYSTVILSRVEGESPVEIRTGLLSDGSLLEAGVLGKKPERDGFGIEFAPQTEDFAP